MTHLAATTFTPPSAGPTEPELNIPEAVGQPQGDLAAREFMALLAALLPEAAVPSYGDQPDETERSPTDHLHEGAPTPQAALPAPPTPALPLPPAESAGCDHSPEFAAPLTPQGPLPPAAVGTAGSSEILRGCGIATGAPWPDLTPPAGQLPPNLALTPEAACLEPAAPQALAEPGLTGEQHRAPQPGILVFGGTLRPSARVLEPAGPQRADQPVVLPASALADSVTRSSTPAPKQTAAAALINLAPSAAEGGRSPAAPSQSPAAVVAQAAGAAGRAEPRPTAGMELQTPGPSAPKPSATGGDGAVTTAPAGSIKDARTPAQQQAPSASVGQMRAGQDHFAIARTRPGDSTVRQQTEGGRGRPASQLEAAATPAAVSPPGSSDRSEARAAQASGTSRPQPPIAGQEPVRREISLVVSEKSGSSPWRQPVSLRLVEREGQIRVSVRSPDARLAEALRGELPTLVERLERSGFETHLWRPVADGVSQSTSWEPARNDGGESPRGFDAHGRGQDGNARQQSRQQRQAESWLEALAAGPGQELLGRLNHGFRG